MPNDNCLDGMQCPKCGSNEPFAIEATSSFIVFDDGTDHFKDVQWTDTAPCKCMACKHHGNVASFTVNESTKPREPSESHRLVGAARGAGE